MVPGPSSLPDVWEGLVLPSHHRPALTRLRSLSRRINKRFRADRTRPRRFLWAIGLLLAVAACAPAAEPVSGPLELTDGLGRQISLAGPAQRIVSLAPSNTEIVFAVGAGTQMIGRDEVSDYPAEAADVASIGSTFGELNTEAILALDPDLVLTAGITAPEQLQTLETLGLTTFALADPIDFEGLYRNLEIVGVLTGHQEQAGSLAASLRERVENVVNTVSAGEPVSVFYEVDGSDPSAPWTTGSGTFQDLLIQLAGGQNVAAGIDGWGQIDLEELVTQDPEVIVFGEGPFVATTADSFADRPGWGGMAAVQAGRVIPIDTNWIDRPGPRLVDGLEAMARAIHPELSN